MVEFFQTRMGHKFYEFDVPRIGDALEKIADRLPGPDKKIAKAMASLAKAAEGLMPLWDRDDLRDNYNEEFEALTDALIEIKGVLGHGN